MSDKKCPYCWLTPFVLKVEFRESKGANFKWLLRLARRFDSFEDIIEDGVHYYSVSFTEKDRAAFQQIEHMTRFGDVVWYVNGELSSREAIFLLLNQDDFKWERKLSMDWPPPKTREAPLNVIKPQKELPLK